MLDRVSRVTQGDLVMSMDQLLTKPRLGSCHKFCIQPFTLANSESNLCWCSASAAFSCHFNNNKKKNSPFPSSQTK